MGMAGKGGEGLACGVQHGLTFTPNLRKKKKRKNRKPHHIAEAF